MLRRSGWRAVLALGLLAALPGEAAALTLADLAGGASFTSGNSLLRFESFEVTIGGALDTDSSGDAELGDYVVNVLERGFQIVGPMGVADGNAGDVLVAYDVVGLQGLEVLAGSLVFNGAAVGTGALANVAEDFFTPEGELVEDLLVFATGGGAVQKVDFAPLGSFPVLHVEKDILVASDGGVLASISFVDQEFTVVPEPGTWLLAMLGLVGLSWRRGPRGGPPRRRLRAPRGAPSRARR
jgi:hypothetical protein